MLCFALCFANNGDLKHSNAVFHAAFCEKLRPKTQHFNSTWISKKDLTSAFPGDMI